MSWIDAETFIPLRTEHMLKGRIVLVANTRDVKPVQGVPTPRRVSFEKPLEDGHVELYIDEVDYQAEIPEDVFSTLSLMRGRLDSE